MPAPYNGQPKHGDCAPACAKWGRALMPPALLVILLATLVPAPGRPTPLLDLCLVCGSRGLADALSNFALFLPLGLAVGLRGKARLLLIVPAALSLSIELLQVWIPGRDPSLGDMVFNTAGGATGVLVGWAVSGGALLRHLRPASFTLGAGAGLVLVGTGWLVQPSLPDTTYYGQWTPELGHFAPYEGTVSLVRIGGASVPSWRVADPADIRQRLLARDPLEVRFTVGPAPARLAPVFSIHDQHRSEVVLFGARRDDLVFRLRTRASDWLLDPVSVVLRGALRGAVPGQSVHAVVERPPGKVCIAVHDDRFCRGAPHVAMGWQLIVGWAAGPASFEPLLNMLWMALLFVAPGFTLPKSARLAVGAGVLVAAGLLLVPLAFGLAPTPIPALAGSAAGLVAGAAARRRQEVLSTAG
jgi:hypothetical protein